MHLLRPFSAPPELPALAGNSWQLPATRARVTHSYAHEGNSQRGEKRLCPIERERVNHRRDSLLVVGAWAYGRMGGPQEVRNNTPIRFREFVYPSVLSLVESVATGIVSPPSNNDTPQPVLASNLAMNHRLAIHLVIHSASIGGDSLFVLSFDNWCSPELVGTEKI